MIEYDNTMIDQAIINDIRSQMLITWCNKERSRKNQLFISISNIYPSFK